MCLCTGWETCLHCPCLSLQTQHCGWHFDCEMLSVAWLTLVSYVCVRVALLYDLMQPAAPLLFLLPDLTTLLHCRCVCDLCFKLFTHSKLLS